MAVGAFPPKDRRSSLETMLGGYEEDTIAQITTDDNNFKTYTGWTFDVRRTKRLSVACEVSVNKLDYQVLGYVHSSGTMAETIASGTLAVNDKMFLHINENKYAKIVIQYKPKVAGNHGSVKGEWIAEPYAVSS